ncbi:MAG: bifunctional (p)ppGpp synthetase/guanosine-3',5'-bis(diphosphate) 3'-pyrophosphohydrolase [Saprospiraceae bacterium]|jgi:GTP pyrophosphokinase|nr:bifunctional (p)ppGpp synthetase/guanosine-3',5'-bis(diphosphate) 3'-pyrophosphohydrolase [Saprospiraceae bacterium]MBK7435636.1 bifunctional (p)ppGpp synthetase/guanosine-3',5'-bis(diphosphate) 3'-pyrophosphohydrolase [Saprospiraceae bacterium]MBK8281938.1 bifunctional (p)ppGpp synthetase/guanosine-3',5'-bis(diphosphate) 3'-pyrophosphohydrolase [Saprospiraceae bacterium]MBK9929887.1 bifunctional (p)ppGpp synthetase/guanosine-3',5'-bis(diphosphate) 3'-pyrophosphohydrolase [Saprospiraceae bact
MSQPAPHIEEIPIDDENDRLLIQNAYRTLLKSFKTPLEETDRSNIRKAYEMAVVAHREQRRKSGEPYILHPIEVAQICLEEIGLGPTAVICALLHDVVEDTSVTLETVRQEFGPKIGMIVDGLTKLDGLYNMETAQAENFKKVLSTLVSDVRVILIKMADRLHNLRTISSMPRHKQLKIAAETDYIYAPLAHRLGLYNIRSEFQDICLQIQEPDAYNEIRHKLEESELERNKYIEKFIEPLKTELDQLAVPYKIHGRPKSISSILNKIKQKKVPFEEIYDLFAVRIIVDVPSKMEKSICWQIYSIVTDVHTPIPERLKDWVTTPKANGYESLHTTVIGPSGRYVEVQIRSSRMDEIAERGFAAHWKYKGISNQQKLYENWLDNIRDILESQHTDAIEFMSDFKTNLFNEEIYVYTPKGDVRILPKGATALDFAFSIHTDLGSRCTGIKVNNKLVPMGYRLEHGDQVQIITNSKQKPSEGWLKLVVTGKAKAKIRQSLKDERKQRADLGKEALERKFKNLKLDLEDNLDRLVKHYQYKTRLDLYEAIASGEIDPAEINQLPVENGKLVFIVPEPTANSTVVTETPATINKNIGLNNKLYINGEPAEQYEYSFASCCGPLPGDDIFGYVTSSSGLKIHRTNCPNSTNLLANFGYRVVKAEWGDMNQSDFVANLLITGIDDGPGVIERISKAISNDLNLNIRSFSIEGKEGYFEGKMSLMVKNKVQLQHAIKSLSKLNDIATVERIE